MVGEVRAPGSHRSLIPVFAALLAVGLVTLSVATTVWQQDRLRDDRVEQLTAEAHDQQLALEHYFSRARGLTQVLAQNSAFEDFYSLPGSRLAKVRAGGHVVREVNEALARLEELFPGQVGEACFIDDSGAENGRAVRGQVAPIEDLSTEEASAPFFAPTFALQPGEVHQTKPYVSPDTGDRVIANATPVDLPRGAGAAIVHFEISLRSFREQAADGARGANIAVIDERNGKLVFETGAGIGASAAQALSDHPDEEVLDVHGRPAGTARVAAGAHNSNRWIVVAAAAEPLPGWLDGLGAPQVALIAMAFALLAFAVVSFRSSQAALHAAALTDFLTGLGNRRKLMLDLDDQFGRLGDESMLVAIYDLDGFKAYNDSFGHPAGDALLVRLAHSLRECLAGLGHAYRIGGDEFCVVARGADHERILSLATDALSEVGKGFEITSSVGAVILPADAVTAEEALQLADQRMYLSKGTGRASAGRQTTDVLMRVLAERNPELDTHNTAVQELCAELADELDLPSEERAVVLRTAALHDIGKVAVPDSVLYKPGPLNAEEWEFIRQHTLIGERILSAAPALAPAANLVRSSHERFDGSGYPDGLTGEEIPLGARIVAVCDAFDAMTNDRPYSRALSREEALAELRRCAGTQFDPVLVEAFVAVCGRVAETAGDAA